MVSPTQSQSQWPIQTQDGDVEIVGEDVVGEEDVGADGIVTIGGR